jgi:hypothetical protein
MDPAGRSGMSESNISHTEGERFGEDWDSQPSDLPPEALTGELGEPVGEIDIVALEAAALPPAGLEGTGLQPGRPEGQAQRGWFRWWYVPAVAVPVAAGVATTVVLINRRRQPVVLRTYTGMLGRLRGWWSDLAGQPATRRATKTVKRGMKKAERSAGTLTESLTERATSALASLEPGTLPGRASGATRAAIDDARSALQDALDRLGAAWQQYMRVSARAQQQAKKSAARTTGTLMGRWQTTARQLGTLRERERFALTAEKAASRLTHATAPVMGAINTASSKTTDAVQSVERGVSSTARAVRAFTFGAVISSIATYLGISRSRARSLGTRESAAGGTRAGYRSALSNRSRQAASGGRGRR